MQKLQRFALLSFAVLTLTIAAFAQHTDISLEGPWVMYVDTSVQHWPVLVAISPGMVSKSTPDPLYYHLLSMDEGDGFPISQPGVYCLTFHSLCAPEPACNKTKNCSLDEDGYPKLVPPLPVKVGKNWDWAHKYLTPTYATAIILPFPDYFKTDSGWFMRFYKQFEQSGIDYKPYNNYDKIASGVVLHYENGPDTFAISNCTPNANVALDLTSCKAQDSTSMDNVGTLHIALRSPESDDACDIHVRRGYPLTMKLLEADNPTIQAIDLAHGYSDAAHTKPQYDDPMGTTNRRCLDDDPQDSTYSMRHPGSAKPLQKNAKPHAMAPKLFLNNTELETLETNVETAENELNKDKNKQSPTEQLSDRLKEIDEAVEKVDKRFPRFSQTRWIHDLVLDAQKQLQRIPEADKHFLDLNGKKLADTLQTAADSSFDKTGNDCKAPIMYGTSQ